MKSNLHNETFSENRKKKSLKLYIDSYGGKNNSWKLILALEKIF